MKSQRSYIERDKLIKDRILIVTDEIIKQNEKINNNLQKYISFCVECHEYTRNSGDVRMRHVLIL